jgi:acyl-CoA synthetase (AMP-forming)/AMP-acid ligase II/alkylation response protein AidB-like acyl-CoA dehydrogenase/acyl carrier protein
MRANVQLPVSVNVYAPANLVDLLHVRAEMQPEAQACLYLGDGEETRGELTFAQLDRQSRAVAARLQGLGGSGECALLLYPAGLEFLSAFFGCLYAGVIAVPLPVPRVKASLTQFLGIVQDLDARILMTTATTMSRLRRLDLAALDRLVCLTTEDTPDELARAWRAPSPAREDVAYLQYTSGSTASRKGVMVTHGSVLANLHAIAERFQHHDESVCVNWLPHIHDLGLVSGMLQPLYHGHRNILMSPTAFVQQPIRWLDAISRYRGTYSNSPNFGYDLCVRRVTEEQRARLDLSSWQVALNGAEPVRWQTIDEFARLFASCGFKPEAMYPAYGLAEATLVVSGGLRDAAPLVVHLDAPALERDRVVETDRHAGARAIVGCGHAIELTSIVIVDPATCTPRADNEIGEIWVCGPAIAAGYRQRPEDTELTFHGRVAGGDGTSYLRTGDLGFLRDGELFITGRLKDLIIVRGDNHYPQDIEWTIEQSHPVFRPGCGAAFSAPVAGDPDGAEQLVVAVELERDGLRTVDGLELERIARRAVAEQHDLHLHTLVLLKTGTVPRTTSGKIQRRQCRADFLAGALSVVWRSTAAEVPAEAAVDEPALQSSVALEVEHYEAPRASASDVCAWLRNYAGECVNSRLMDERRSIAPNVMLDFGNRGILGLLVPPEHGGLGFGARDSLRVIEQLGAIDQTLTMMTIVHNVLGIGPILHHATEEFRGEWLARLASGRELVAFAITEPAAGSNPQGMVSTATAHGVDRWILHGQKSWSGTAGWASVINVFVQSIDADGRPAGVSGFAVPRRTRGLRMGPEALTLGMRGMVQNTIHLEGVQVTRTQCLGTPGAGMKVAQDAMMHGRLAIGAACVGGMKRCLQLLVRYAERRTISTGRLLDNPVLLARVGEWTAALAGIEALVDDIARRVDAGRDVPPDAYVVCKIAGAEWFWRAADDLVQFLGGRGYIETNIAAQLLRDARVTRILEGPTEALTMFLGSRVVNDSAALHAMLHDLGAPALSTRLAAAADAILAKCLSKPRGGSVADARRWAYALIGQVATDAVLRAAMPAGATAHQLAWADERVERAVMAALAQADGAAANVHAADVRALALGYTRSIGDVEQSLAGEDHALDEMLKRREIERPGTTQPAPAEARDQKAEPIAHAKFATPAPVPDATTASSARHPQPPSADHPVNAAAIERFIVGWLARELKLPESSISAAHSVFDCGLDSVTAVMLGATLEDWLGIDINPEIVYDIPEIRRFAAHLAGRQAAH